MNENLEPLFRTGPSTRTVKGILWGFTAALCWWIGIAGTAYNAAGAPYLVIPALVTGVALIAMRRAGNTQTKHIKAPPIRRHSIASRRAGAIVAILCGFTALLSWWIAIVALLVGGGGAQAILVFLFVPVVCTAGTFFAAHSAGWLGRGVRKNPEP
ncbi:hypothetical protein ACIQTZ_14095 [Paenarthrobacter sp. NPDC090520]|uniref:hypothetical protein n=1 Tax=Paenarthrobacter sp. NPDC090520 TaxID=3364382 RepID=UPI0037F5FAD9